MSFPTDDSGTGVILNVCNVSIRGNRHIDLYCNFDIRRVMTGLRSMVICGCNSQILTMSDGEYFRSVFCRVLIGRIIDRIIRGSQMIVTCDCYSEIEQFRLVARFRYILMDIDRVLKRFPNSIQCAGNNTIDNHRFRAEKTVISVQIIDSSAGCREIRCGRCWIKCPTKEGITQAGAGNRKILRLWNSRCHAGIRLDIIQTIVDLLLSAAGTVAVPVIVQKQCVCIVSGCKCNRQRVLVYEQLLIEGEILKVILLTGSESVCMCRVIYRMVKLCICISQIIIRIRIDCRIGAVMEDLK